MKITLKDGSVFEGTATEYAELAKLVEGIAETEECDTPNFEVGDYVVALPTADENYSITTTEMQLGKVLEVGDKWIKIRIVKHEVTHYEDLTGYSVRSEHFRKATDEEVAKLKNEYIPKDGDIVVITGNTNGSRNKVGDIGKVVGSLYANRVQVRVPGRPNGVLIGNITKIDEMRPATEEEKKQYEQAEKFAKLGRKPGEFKKGDIFKGVGGRISRGLFEVVEIREEGSHPIRFINRDGENDGFSLKAELELIAPVESRVDRVD